MAFIKQDRDPIDISLTSTDITMTTKDDTTIIPSATTTEAGLMSANDKSLIGFAGVGEMVSDNMFINGFCNELTKRNWDDSNHADVNFHPEDGDLSFGYVSYVNSGSRRSIFTDFPIPVNPHTVYRLEASFKHKKGSGVVQTGDPANNDPGSYFGIKEYDADGNAIKPDDVMFKFGTLATLISDYTVGDATIEVDNIDGWDFTDPSQFDRSVIFWDYVSNTGRIWPARTYAYDRNLRDLLIQNQTPTPITGGFSIQTNVSPGQSVFSGATTMPAGTQISMGDSGGTFKYIVAANQKFVPDSPDWVRRFGYIGGFHTDGSNSQHSFSQGTAFVRVIMLPLWTNSYKTDELWVSSVYLHPDPSVNIVRTTVDFPVTGYTGIKPQLFKPISTSGSVTSTLMTQGIVQ